MKRIIRWLITFPILIIAGFLLIANRHSIFISLDPFNAQDPALSFQLPLYIVILLAIFIGLMLGGTLTWVGQHKYRRASRVERNNANKWHHEADDLRKRAQVTTKQTYTPPVKQIAN
ncbi:MAG: LapA family protein [Rhizobiales bacterium]|nr:LapA family protein [Hyphomicrobiales bacterium]NRB14431.1 LapA family protein [Hyphomicrobiales bacterium]